jgi:hypothetical protein
MKKQRDAAEQAAFEQGRHARSVAIGRDQSPLTGKLLPHWEAGWDFEDEAREPKKAKGKK